MTNQINTVSTNLLDITNSFEKDIKAYLDSFETDELLSFSDNNEKRKKLLKDYNNFSLKTKNHIERYETNVAELSVLICKADKLCDNTLTLKLSKEFDRYSALFQAVNKFIKNCECTLLNKSAPAKPGTLILYARELLVSVTNYKNNF